MAEKPCYVCSHIFDNTRPILLVCKDGGDWQFLCGGEHDERELPRIVGINHIIERDESLLELLDLEHNWEAERQSIDKPWVRKRIE